MSHSPPPERCRVRGKVPRFCRGASRQIDYYNAHGTSTVVNDLVETRAVRGVWPNTAELAVTYCRGGDCEFVPPLAKGG